MMYSIRLLFLLLACTCLLFLLIGLVKPWAMLWWEAVQNRAKVIKVYGSLTVFFLLLYFLLGFISQ
jgi:hypothetical protein